VASWFLVLSTVFYYVLVVLLFLPLFSMKAVREELPLGPDQYLLTGWWVASFFWAALIFSLFSAEPSNASSGFPIAVLLGNSACLVAFVVANAEVQQDHRDGNDRKHLVSLRVRYSRYVAQIGTLTALLFIVGWSVWRFGVRPLFG
jgi:hypothetical protein